MVKSDCYNEVLFVFVNDLFSTSYQSNKGKAVPVAYGIRHDMKT